MKPANNIMSARQTAASAELARQTPEAAQAIEREAARQEGEALRHAQSAKRFEQHGDWPTLSRLPMRLTAAIPLSRFKVKDLLALERGQLIESAWASTDDVPLKIGAVQFSWSEFEVVEQRMAARLTRLA